MNLLIADDVGLGKTIEAGRVIQELLLRHPARTVMIVCIGMYLGLTRPAALKQIFATDLTMSARKSVAAIGSFFLKLGLESRQSQAA